MKALQFAGLLIFLLSIYSFAGLKDDTKKTFNSFSGGVALPLSNSSVPTIPKENMKELKPGWEAAWTFFGKPFLESENGFLSSLAFGGTVSYARWQRDSTYTPVTFLGAQGVVRYYAPPLIKPLDIFAHASGGWFMGEYGFSDHDTVDWNHPDFEPAIRTTQHRFGFNLGIGVDIDVIELLPIFAVVFTNNEPSVWLAIKLGMVF